MPVLQQYYTSYHDEISGRLGLGIKATSPGISSRLQDAIDKLISYRIPPSLDERAISTHPVALRYWYNNPGESIFLCSQSIGSDVNGRPGNFFAHTVVMAPDMFASSPPILYWNSPFWQKKDTESRSRIDSLPVLASFDAEPSFDIEGMWDFLAQGNRRTWLYKLLCAVVHANTTYRRILIQDTTENVVWWIAIVSSLLPPDYRPLLSFSTYHHDPMQSPFTITGVPKDAPLGNYTSYFVLNAWDGLCSEVADSLYARAVTDTAHPDSFAEQLLPLLTFAKRFPRPTVIDEQLDMVMLYAKIQTGRSSVTLSPEELKAIQLAVQSIEQLSNLALDETDELNPLDELKHLRSVLAETLRLQPSPAVAAQYQRIEQLLKKQSANEELQGVHQTLETLERLQNFEPEDIEKLHRLQVFLAEPSLQQQSQVHYAAAERVAALLQKQKALVVGRMQKDLQAFVELLAQSGGQGVSTSHFSQLQQFYDYNVLVEQINQQAFLQYLFPVLWHGNSSMVRATWQCLGRYIEPGPQSQELLVNSLKVVDRLLKDPQRLNDGNTLLDAIYETMAQTGRQLLWFNLAVQSGSLLPEAVVLNFYYKCVSSLKLDQRLPYRTSIAKSISNSTFILVHEIVNDVYNAGLQQGLQEIENWVRYARLQRYDVNAVMEVGFDQLQKMSNPQQWRELAPRILGNPNLMPLSPALEEKLVPLVLPALSLNNVSPTDIELCKKYHTNKALSEDTRTTLDTILAMASGEMDEKLAQRIQQQVNILLPHEYISNIQRFFPEFLQHDVTLESHRNMISAFFTRNFGYDNDFWKIYLGETGAFTRLFLQSTMAEKAVTILDDWFTFRPANFQQPYIVQEFFLKLPMTLARLEQSSKFSEVVSNVTPLMQKRPWYPVVQVYFPKKSNVIEAAAGKVKEIMLSPPWQKPKSGGGEELEAQKEQLNARVADLFYKDKKLALAKHELMLKSKVYVHQMREQFWEYYWEHFRNMLTSGDADLILDVLSFWFDKSFSTLGKDYYLPQTFFFGLFNVLDRARNQPAFSDIAWKIAEKVEKQKKEQYLWYPLVRNFFPQPGK